MPLMVNHRLPAQLPASTPVADLSQLEVEVIDLFVHLSRVLGLPKSIAEIYGLLFISPQPLSMEELMDRLALSKGSASQGLKFLRNLGAVKLVYVPGSRRDYYVAETEFRQLLAGFVKERLNPYFDSGLDRLERIEALFAQMPATEQESLAGRIDKLRQWEKRGKQFVPIIAKLLG